MIDLRRLHYKYIRLTKSTVHIKSLATFLLLVLVPFSSFSQNSIARASQPPAPDAGELTQLLKDFLQGASRNDLATHARFWADDVIYTSSAGKRRGKADILADVRKSVSEPSDEKTTYTAEDIRIQQYGTTAVVAFRLVGTTSKGGTTETAQYLNTGTFLKRDGKWQVVAWQATKIPSESESKK